MFRRSGVDRPAVDRGFDDAGPPAMSAWRGKHGRLALIASGSLAMAAVIGNAAAAGDNKAGRAKALMCQACHGLDGLSKVPDAPNVAGQPASYLVSQLQAYRSGLRKNEAMSVVASTLSDTDIADLAAYFAAIEVKVVRIPGE